MAPFSTCSICNAKTRKVTKHPTTLKRIYVCPKCFNDKKHLKKNVAEEKEVQLNLDKNAPCVQLKQTEQVASGVQMVKEAEKENIANVEIKKKIDPDIEQNLPNEQLKQLKLSDPCPITKVEKCENEKVLKAPIKLSTIQTPPIMEIVVINNRKYIAVSAAY